MLLAVLLDVSVHEIMCCGVECIAACLLIPNGYYHYTVSYVCTFYIYVQQYVMYCTIAQVLVYRWRYELSRMCNHHYYYYRN